VRLYWRNAPSVGAALAIGFGEINCAARIIWSNTYFAGAKFDSLLSPEDLNSALNRNNNLRDWQTKNGAPKDAAHNLQKAAV
jgi:hypothetical protein